MSTCTPASICGATCCGSTGISLQEQAAAAVDLAYRARRSARPRPAWSRRRSPIWQAVAALPPRAQEELLDAITAQHLQPAADRLVAGDQSRADAGGAGGQGDGQPGARNTCRAGYDPQAFIARLAEIVCHDNFTEMHAFKHHQAIVEEYYATREPWRWMHLVCGAQAAAISFGKNMAVYEEYLELLHAA